MLLFNNITKLLLFSFLVGLYSSCYAATVQPKQERQKPDAPTAQESAKSCRRNAAGISRCKCLHNIALCQRIAAPAEPRPRGGGIFSGSKARNIFEIPLCSSPRAIVPVLLKTHIANCYTSLQRV